MEDVVALRKVTFEKVYLFDVLKMEDVVILFKIFSSNNKYNERNANCMHKILYFHFILVLWKCNLNVLDDNSIWKLLCQCQ